MKELMKHNNYMQYLDEVIKICTDCTEGVCFEDRTTDSSHVCPIFKEKRKQIREKYYGKKV